MRTMVRNYYIWICTFTGVVVLLCAPVQGATLAHWDFETDLVDGDTANGVGHTVDDGTFQAALSDISGTGNDLSVWNSAGHVFNADVATNTATGSTLSVGNADSWPGLFTDRDLKVGGSNVGALTSWTIEASVKFNDVGGWRTIVGKDGFDVGSDGSDAPLYLSKRNDSGKFGISFSDGSGNTATLSGTTDPQIDTWYHVAATSDGTTLRLYVNGVEEGNMASLSQMAALDPAGMAGTATHSWSVARGMYGNDHGDRLDGLVDDVRISDVALLPSDFLFNTSSGGALTNVVITGITVTPIGAGETVNLEWVQENGGVYQVQVATNLLDTTSNRWDNVGMPISAGSSITTNTSGSGQNFYRILGTPGP